MTAFLENHRMRHWADGGGTDPNNLLSLCPFHHREHHKGVFTITGTPAIPDGLIFTTRRGYRIGAVAPWPPPKPPDPTPPNTEILRGDTCDTAWLQIPPNTPPPRPPGPPVPGHANIGQPPRKGSETPGKDPPSSDAA